MSLVFATVDALAQALVQHFERAAAEAIAARGRFTCALTGGSAAKTLYPQLARAKIDFASTHFFFSDERCVPLDHPQSNYRLAFETLLGPARVPAANVHRVETERPPDEAAEHYARALLPLDVVHLGLGADGHVCSLFPGHRLLQEHQHLVSALTDSPKPPPARVTLTLPGLAAAQSLWFLVMGEAKSAAVKAALDDPRSLLPAALAHRSARSSLWFLDAPAATQLARR